MKKLIIYSVITAAVALLLACAGNTVEESSNNDFSHLFKIDMGTIEFGLIEQETKGALSGLWENRARGANTISRIQFEENGHFSETILNRLTKDEVASFGGRFNQIGDRLSVTLYNGTTFHYTFSVEENLLKLNPTDQSHKSIVR